MDKVTKQIGKIPVYKGVYAVGNTYNKLNQVSYLNSTFMCVEDNVVSEPATIDVNGNYIVNSGWVISANGMSDVKLNKITTDKVNEITNGVIITDSGAVQSVGVKENTTYKYGELTSLTITSIEDSNIPSFIYFSSGATPTTFAYPSSLTIRGYSVPIANAKYMISVFNNNLTIVRL